MPAAGCLINPAGDKLVRRERQIPSCGPGSRVRTGFTWPRASQFTRHYAGARYERGRIAGTGARASRCRRSLRTEPSLQRRRYTRLHRLWLGPIYSWAGEYRSVNIGKGGFQFAHAPLIARLMADLERGALRQNTPCHAANDAEVARALAEVHAELILVHPFRDGNGRLARLLALLMALQAGLPPLDFGPMISRGKRVYIAGIHSAMNRDYSSLTAMMVRVIARSKRRAASSGR